MQSGGFTIAYVYTYAYMYFLFSFTIVSLGSDIGRRPMASRSRFCGYDTVHGMVRASFGHFTRYLGRGDTDDPSDVFARIISTDYIHRLTMQDRRSSRLRVDAGAKYHFPLCLPCAVRRFVRAEETARK